MASSVPPVGFLGLGAMGHAMSLSLLRRSFPVTGFDISTKTLESFLEAASSITEAKAQVASSPAAAVKGKQLVVIMVANQNHVESALLSPETGAIHSLSKNAAVLINATVSPTYVIELRQRLTNDFNRPDIVLVDAPVSGGTVRSATGTLTIMASSDEPSNLDRPDVRAALNALSDNGKNLYIIPGGLGSGMKLKALNQVNCGINIVAASEIMGLAAVIGFDTKAFYDYVVSRNSMGSTEHAHGWSWMLQNRGERMLTSTPKLSSATHIIVKDIGIVLYEAGQLDISLPLVSKARGVFDTAMTAGFATADDSCVVQTYLGPARANLVIEKAGNGTFITDSESQSEDERETERQKLVLLDLAHACIHLMGAYETAKFAEALQMTDAERAKRWIEIIGGAAGGSPVFTRAMNSVYRSIFHPELKSEGTLEERFRGFVKNKSEFDGRLDDLDGLIKLADEQKYDLVLVKEARAWLERLLQ